MIFRITIGVIILTALTLGWFNYQPVQAGIDFDGTNPTTQAETDASLEELEFVTFVFHINPDVIVSGATEYTIIHFAQMTLQPHTIFIEASKLFFRAGCFVIMGECDDGLWSVPILANTDQIVCAQWNVGDIDNDGTPIVHINGTKQTVTTVTSPNSTADNASGVMDVGHRAGASAFDGEINALAIYVLELGDKACEIITKDATKTVIVAFCG